MDDSFVNTVISLSRDNNWSEILKLDAKCEPALKLLWVWPSVENLNFIAEKLSRFEARGVISLGCGCGLFEWILMQYSDFPVIGYEVNREWWESKYSNPLFVQHVYPEFPVEELDPSFALLFVYFNDGLAFIDYVDCYRGNVIIIIGPGKDRGTHTEPEPFNANFGKSKWILDSFQAVRDTKDFIAVYIRAPVNS